MIVVEGISTREESNTPRKSKEEKGIITQEEWEQKIQKNLKS